jgi:RHS repeat-associated protein
MTTRGSQTLTWDVENRVMSVNGGASFVYDGDGKRIKKTENGETILYINRYYEKNLTTGNTTTSYYLGDRLVAQKTGDVLRYIHQDSLSSTSVMTTSTGDLDSSIKYLPFGATRSGSVSTDKKFTGKRLDGTGLYFYEARYYDPTIGRFTSPDTAAPDLMNPQSLNKYSYCFNNPLKYNDPTGHWPNWAKIGHAIASAAKVVVNVVKENINVIQTALDVAGMIPVIGEICDVASGIISVAKGDWAGAALSLASAIPIAGSVAGGATPFLHLHGQTLYRPEAGWDDSEHHYRTLYTCQPATSTVIAQKTVLFNDKIRGSGGNPPDPLRSFLGHIHPFPLLHRERG